MKYVVFPHDPLRLVGVLRLDFEVERARLKWPPVVEVLVGTPDYDGRPE